MSILSIQRPQGGVRRGCQSLCMTESLRAVMHVPGDFNLEIKFVNREYVVSRAPKELRD